MLKQPDLEPFDEKPDGRVIYRLTQDYIYDWEKDGNHYRLIIHEGFETDIASIPRIVWTFSGFLPDGLHRPAALIHDYLYQNRGLPLPGSYQVHQDGRWQNLDVTWTRQECDKLFARIMREAGTGKIKRRLMYLSVRAFGGFYW